MTTLRAPQSVIDRLDERFRERLEQIPVLRQRAGAEGIDEVRTLEDLVPLLFPHTVYKSYPPSLVDQGRWAQMNRWLDSTSTRRVDVDVDGVHDVDGWLDRLAGAGHFVAASSGTSGKSSFLDKSAADLDAAQANRLLALRDAGVLPDNSWHVLSLAPIAANVVGRQMKQVLLDGFARPDHVAPFPVAPPTEGHQAYMARLTALRRAMADGTADPDDVAALEAESARRQEETDRLLDHYAGEVLRRPGDKYLFGTKMALAWRFVEALRARGARPGDLSGANAILMAGGTKGVELPEDHVAQIMELLNVDRTRFVQFYSMQEINLGLPSCVEGRYHARSDLVLLVLDEPGEALAPVSDGQVEGRAAFFDFSIDGRWGGTISGDRIRADLGSCPCGRPGPTVLPGIVRYATLADADKITCAGTMDAYVRGFVDG
jgi:hypothetical protein